MGAAGLEGDHFAVDAQRGELAAQVLGTAGQDREGAPVDRHHLAHLEEFAGEGGLARVHGEEVADRQEGEPRAVELADQLHVGEEGGVAGVVEGEAAAGHGDHEAGGDAAVDQLALMLDRSRCGGRPPG